MKLSELLLPLKDERTIGNKDIDITGITHNSKKAKKGCLFVAITGLSKDGATFIPEAVKKGAKVIVVEKEVEVPEGVTKVIVPNARVALAEISAAFYDHPSRKLKIVGITGTNGKTTIAYFVEEILRKNNIKVGLIGTVEARINGKSIPTQLTTPESSELQELLAQMIKEGVTHVVMEVSSHSLQLNRVFGCEFDAAVYTNLSHDHLDFHGDMQSYLDAKMKLFQYLGKHSKKDVTAIINVDDPYGKRIMTYVEGNILTYGVYSNANLTASGFDIEFSKMTFTCKTADEDFKVTSNILGIHNAYNIMAAVLVCRTFGVELMSILKSIKELDYIPGRFERIKFGNKYPVLVDFAHSPDSLQKLLETLRCVVKGRIILVFGCPGDRDKTKRPLMGELAARLADFVIVSTDDPHTEKPGNIMKEIEEGVVRAGGKLQKNYLMIEDRRTAIDEAIHLAKNDDLVVLAGRGHEKFQDYNGIKVRIDDREIAKEVLVKKR